MTEPCDLPDSGWLLTDGGGTWPEFGPGPGDTESVLRRVDRLPALRPGLRVGFLAEVHRIERRRRLLRQVSGALSLLLVGGAFVAAMRSETSAAMSDRRLAAESAHSPEYILSASREPDSWALVEAYNRLRDSRTAVFRSVDVEIAAGENTVGAGVRGL